MVLVLLAAVVVLVLAAGAFGVGPWAMGARPAGAHLAVAAAAAAGVVLLAVVAVGVVGLGAGRETAGRDEARRAEPATPVTVAPAPPRRSSGRGITSPVLGPAVVVERGSGPRAVGELRRDTVLQLRVRGFEPLSTVQAAQCARGRCGNAVDVNVGPDGTASFDYLVVDDFVADAGRCRADAPMCTVVVRALGSGERAELTTVFEDPVPPPGSLTVAPRTELRPGDEIDVRIRGVLPGAPLEVAVCPRDGDGDGASCLLATRRAVSADARGNATTSLRVDDATCTGERRCDVAVRSSRAFVRVAPVALSFASPPGADYTAGRVAAGLAVALALVAVAAHLVRRTDWSPVGEEAAPEIDDADYADLDAIVAALPPEPEDDDVVLAEP